MITLRCNDKKERKGWLNHLIYMGDLFLDIEKEFKDNTTVELPFDVSLVDLLFTIMNERLQGIVHHKITNKLEFFYFQQFIRMKNPIIHAKDLFLTIHPDSLKTFLNHIRTEDIPKDTIHEYMKKIGIDNIVVVMSAFMDVMPLPEMIIDIKDMPPYVACNDKYFGFFIAYVLATKGKSFKEISPYIFLEELKNFKAYVFDVTFIQKFTDIYGEQFILDFSKFCFSKWPNDTSPAPHFIKAALSLNKPKNS